MAVPKETTTKREHINTQKVTIYMNSFPDKTALYAERTSTHQFRLRFDLILPLVKIRTKVGAVLS